MPRSLPGPSTEPDEHLPVLFDIPHPFAAECGRLRVLDDLGRSAKDVFEKLINGNYQKPFIVDEDGLRYLHFSLAHIQSVMRIDDPDALDLSYTRKMMGFLVFNPQPRRILMLGLGGGSLAKFCRRQLPDSDVTVVEINPDVITLRRHFMVPEEGQRFRVLCADAAEHVATLDGEVDVLLADAFDRVGLATSVDSQNFLQNACRSLAPNGILVMNLTGDPRSYTRLLAEAVKVFERRAILISVQDGFNHIFLAFKGPRFNPDWSRLKFTASELQGRHGLDFPLFVQKMAQAAQRGLEACIPGIGDAWR
jgi:spermidine synthase